MHSIEIQRPVPIDLPPDPALMAWARAALASVEMPSAVVIRLVDEEESRQLNRGYRQKDLPTNVLSFPTGLDEATTRLLADADEAVPLGDLVICVPIVLEEARAQRKSEDQHWAHMVIHGVLHLLGYDHQETDEAVEMESRERDLMARLGFPDPYAQR